MFTAKQYASKRGIPYREALRFLQNSPDFRCDKSSRPYKFEKIAKWERMIPLPRAITALPPSQIVRSHPPAPRREERTGITKIWQAPDGKIILVPAERSPMTKRLSFSSEGREFIRLYTKRLRSQNAHSSRVQHRQHHPNEFYSPPIHR